MNPIKAGEIIVGAAEAVAPEATAVAESAAMKLFEASGIAGKAAVGAKADNAFFDAENGLSVFDNQVLGHEIPHGTGFISDVGRPLWETHPDYFSDMRGMELLKSLEKKV
ncbi:MAG TPA: hypothetical protein V6C76_10580 [Drouetiella sp.]